MNDIPVARPPVVIWYLVFCLLMSLMYAVCLVLAGVLTFLDPAMIQQLDPSMSSQDLTALRVQGVIMLVVCLPLMVVYSVAPFLPPRKWTWVTGIVLIAISLTSCCCLPAGIPLLIFWIKPQTKAYFDA